MRKFVPTCIAIGLAAGVLDACPIPVYQYALEHWDTDPYVVTVSHDGTLPDDAQAALERLRQAADDASANLELRERAAADGPAVPQLEVRYPAIARIRAPVWEGPLTADTVAALLHSPVRTRLTDALIARTSAVWLLLESGNRSADRDAERLLREQLAQLETAIMVPESADWGGETVTIDHNVNFKLMTLRRDDPAEQMLVRMLLASEADLDDYRDQPIVFPIYGRGLMLYALIGRGINGWTLKTAAEFLTGPCSCQIKAANPGTDLLTDADWTGSITPLSPAAVGTTTGAGSFLRHLDEAAAEEP